MELVRHLAGLSASHIRQFRDDDSYVDRLSHRYTTAICLVFAILVTTKQYAGKIERAGLYISPSFIIYRRSYRLLGKQRLASTNVVSTRSHRYPLNSNHPTKPTRTATVGLPTRIVRDSRAKAASVEETVAFLSRYSHRSRTARR